MNCPLRPCHSKQFHKSLEQCRFARSIGANNGSEIAGQVDAMRCRAKRAEAGDGYGFRCAPFTLPR